MQALYLLLVKCPPTWGRKAEGVQLPRQLAKAHPLRPAGGNKGRRLPQARVLLQVGAPHIKQVQRLRDDNADQTWTLDKCKARTTAQADKLMSFLFAGCELSEN